MKLEPRHLITEAPDLYAALDRLTARAVRLSAQLHEWEAADVLLPAKLDKAWELLSVEIENARAALAKVTPSQIADLSRKLERDRARLIEALRSIWQMRAELEAKQAEIDRLMLEYCPNEMTPEQIANWQKHQKPTKGARDE